MNRQQLPQSEFQAANMCNQNMAIPLSSFASQPAIQQRISLGRERDKSIKSVYSKCRFVVGCIFWLINSTAKREREAWALWYLISDIYRIVKTQAVSPSPVGFYLLSRILNRQLSVRGRTRRRVDLSSTISKSCRVSPCQSLWGADCEGTLIKLTF